MNDTTRNAHIAERRSMLRTELTVELLAAFANGEGMLREYRNDGATAHNEIAGRVIERELFGVLTDLLDERNGAGMNALINVLMHSECPEVAALRTLLASIYSERADDIADMEAVE
jgi:hypothetical protein